jgi:hypothetical protein
VQQIIIEILLNFVGAKVFAIFAPDPDGGLSALLAEGAAVGDIPRREAGAAGGLIGDVFAGRPAHIASAPVPARLTSAEPLVALPLRVRLQGRITVVGVVAIWEFLLQKQDLHDVDVELFNLLSESAGVALEAAQCAAQAGQGPHLHAERGRP